MNAFDKYLVLGINNGHVPGNQPEGMKNGLHSYSARRAWV